MTDKPSVSPGYPCPDCGKAEPDNDPMLPTGAHMCGGELAKEALRFVKEWTKDWSAGYYLTITDVAEIAAAFIRHRGKP